MNTCNVGHGYRTRSIVTKATREQRQPDRALFARSLKNLIAGLELCRALGIDFVSVTEAVDTSLPAGEMLFHMIGAVAQIERSLIAERVRSGLANARANGKVLGRPALRKLTRKEVAELRRHGAREVPFRSLAEKFGVSVWTAHRLCAGRVG